jgi:hypothetical protein
MNREAAHQTSHRPENRRIAAASPTAPSQILTSCAWSPNGKLTALERSSPPPNALGAVGTIHTHWHFRHWKAPFSLAKDNQMAPRASQDGQGGATRELHVGP